MVEKEKKSSEWVEQEASAYWNPTTEGEEVIGEITDMKKGEFGETFTIRKDDGSEIKTPSHSVLQDRMSRLDIGDRVKIVFKGEGEAKKGKNAPKLYEVFSKKA